MKQRFMMIGNLFLIIGCFLIVFAATPMSVRAIVGYFFLGLALVAVTAAFTVAGSSNTANRFEHFALSDEQKKC